MQYSKKNEQDNSIFTVYNSSPSNVFEQMPNKKTDPNLFIPSSTGPGLGRI